MVNKVKYLFTHSPLHSFNTFFNAVTAKFRLSRSSLEPRRVEIEVTNKCNMRCIHCTRTNHFLAKKKSLDIGILEFGNFVKIIDQFSYLDYIELQGLGEPLLHPELFRIIEYARKKNISVGLVTNLSMLNKEACNNLVESKLNTLVLSIDSFRAETFEKIRPGIRFSDIIQNLKTAKIISEGKIDVSLHLVVTNENIDDLEGYIHTADSLGLGKVSFTDQNLDMAGDNKESLRIRQSARLRAAIDRVIRLSREKKIQFSYFKLDSDTWPPEETRHPCSFLWNFPYITWDGFVTPCCARPYPKEFNFGNVFKTNFRQIWNSEDYRRFRRLLKTKHIPMICIGCPHSIL